MLPECVFGFVPGKHGVLEAAKKHCGAQWVYSLDLRDFFPSIKTQQVVEGIKSIGYSMHAADVISRLCTLNGKLPQGSPASPVLSNLVFLQTDAELVKIAANYGVRYTRYADDLVFSGVAAVPNGLQETVNALLIEHGWQIAEEKEHLSVLPARLKVHGLLVHGENPRLTKGYRNRVRAYRHLIANEKVAAKDMAKIKGHIAYALLIESSCE